MDNQIERVQKTSNTMQFSINYANRKDLSLLALTDVHFDSLYCDRKLLKKHLDEVKKRNGAVFFNGDLFDVMGCYKDPRAKNHDVRKEYIKPDESYLDLIIKDVYEFLEPYKDLILFMGYGNHETAILKHRDTDPLKRLVYMLNQSGANILTSKYFGVAKFRFHYNNTHIRKKYLVHHHGYGGNAKRSKGVLNVDLDSQNFPFADIIFSGHTHKKWYVPETQTLINANDELKNKVQYHIKGGSYKGLSSPANMGWAVEKGMKPTVTGAWFINFKINGYQEIETNIEESQ